MEAIFLNYEDFKLIIHFNFFLDDFTSGSLGY